MPQSSADRQRTFRARKAAKLAPIHAVLERVEKFLTQYPDVVPQFDTVMRRFASEVRDRRKPS